MTIPAFAVRTALDARRWQLWEDRAVQWLGEVLRIDTTNPPGNEGLCASWVQAILTQYGVSSQLYELVPGRGNVVARLEGHGSGKGHDPLLLTAHMDVVPHDKRFWTQDPFGGAIVDGWMYGRGAVDMKFMLIENLVTFLALRESGLKLTRDVIFLALADEEAGCEHGARFMVDRHPEAIRARWGINELGGFPIYVGKQQRKAYLVQTAEKGLAWLRIRIPGSPGHGSLVQHDNPVSKAAAVVSALQKGVHPHTVTPAARDFIAGLAGQAGAVGAVLKMLLNPLTYGLAHGLVPDPAQRNVFRAVLHDTANPTVFHGGVKVNVVPSEVVIEVDGRTLPGQTTEGFLAPIRAILPAGSQIEIISEGPPYVVPASGALWDQINSVMSEADPGTAVIPYLMTGFSDSKYLGQLGADIYGFAPVHFPPHVALTSLVHGHDERIPVDGFRWGSRIHYETVARFCA